MSARSFDADAVEAEVDRIRSLGITALRARWRMMFGAPPPAGLTKDMIKRAGRNVYPHELEEFVGGITGVRRGCVAAFPSPDPRTGTERLIVLAETRLTGPDELAQLRHKISEASASLLDLQPDEILLAPPHTVPKTSSGKLRRSKS